MAKPNSDAQILKWIRDYPLNLESFREHELNGRRCLQPINANYLSKSTNYRIKTQFFYGRQYTPPSPVHFTIADPTTANNNINGRILRGRNYKE